MYGCRRRRRLCCSGVRKEWEGDLVVGVAFEKELEALFGVDGGVEQGGRVLTGAFQLDEVVEICRRSGRR